MQQRYCNTILGIIGQQENMIGPLAWQEARRVRGLVITNHTVDFAPGYNPAIVIGQLVLRYERLYGAASRLATRQAVAMILALVPDEKFIASYVVNDRFVTFTNFVLVQQLVQSEVVADALQFIDGIVLDVTHPDNELNAIVAQAAILQKPTLCLYQADRPPKDFFQAFAKADHNNIVIRPYSEKTLPEQLNQFARRFMFRELADIPNIKYTLRLTARLDKYLAWLASLEKVNKAEYMRKLLEDKLNSDTIYQTQAIAHRDKPGGYS